MSQHQTETRFIELMTELFHATAVSSGVFPRLRRP